MGPDLSLTVTAIERDAGRVDFEVDYAGAMAFASISQRRLCLCGAVDFSRKMNAATMIAASFPRACVSARRIISGVMPGKILAVAESA